MRKRAQGAVLVAALLISMILLMVGLGFLGQRRGQYHARLSSAAELKR